MQMLKSDDFDDINQLVIIFIENYPIWSKKVN